MEHALLIFCVALFALAALALAAALSQEKERRNAFAHAAVRLGMQFELRADALIEEYGVLPLFGYRDVGFEHQPGFSEVYCLRGQDEPAMRQLFQPALLARLQQAPGWHVEGHEDRLAVYRAGRLVKPEGLFGFVEETARVAQIFRGD